MKPYARRCRAQGWLIAGLVLVCGGWLAPSAAEAGCSHDVTTRAAAAHSRTTGLDPLVAFGEPSNERGRRSPLEGPPARPCSGFGCSRDSGPPPAAPMAVPRIDVWGCFDHSAFALQTHSSPFPSDSDLPHSLDRADRLARPPRP